MYENRRKHDQQFMELTKQYEALLNSKNAEIERVQESVEREVSSRAKQKDIQSAGGLNAKTLEIQNVMSAELATLKHESTTVLTHVRKELATAKRERDTEYAEAVVGGRWGRAGSRGRRGIARRCRLAGIAGGFQGAGDLSSDCSKSSP
jgi:hypothetical protein